MIVYVETNYILEPTYLQRQYQGAEGLLTLAETGRFRMVVPAFAAIESRMSREKRAKQRKDRHQKLDQEVKELSRSAPYADIKTKSQDLVLALVNSIEDEKTRLSDILDRLFRCAETIPLTGQVVQTARGFESQYGLSAADAVVLAAVIDHLQTNPPRPRYFLSKDRDAFFTNPDIRQLFAAHQCTTYGNLQEAYYKISSALDRAT